MNAALSRLDARRAEAAEQFRTLGVPHRRVEAWKYSDLRVVADADAVSNAGAARWTIEHRSEAVEFVDLSSSALPDWVRARLGALKSDSVMGAASLAFAYSGFALRVPRGKSGDVRLSFASAGQARVLIVLEDGANLSYIETVPGGLEGLQNIGMEVRVGENAHFTQARTALASAKAVQISDIAGTVARSGSYRLYSGAFGAELSRLELKLSLDGDGAEAHLAGVGVLADGTHSDVTTHITVHAAGNTHEHAAFQECRRRKVARDLSGQDHGRERRERIGQPTDRQGAVDGRAHRSRPETRTRNLRRRRQMRPWRGSRRPRCGSRCSISAPAAFRNMRRATC